MAAIGKQGIQIKVDKLFFDNIFEKERIALQKKISSKTGVQKNLSQVKFTQMIALNKAQLKIPKFKFELDDGRPKKKKR